MTGKVIIEMKLTTATVCDARPVSLPYFAANITVLFALGADAVAIGRVMMKPLEEGGVEGVKALVKKLNDELIFMMAATGFADVASMDDSCLIIPPFMPHA